MTTKPARALTLKDRLSHLTYQRGCQLLGRQGRNLLYAGASYDQINLSADVRFKKDRFTLTLPAPGPNGTDIVATIEHAPDSRYHLKTYCSGCDVPCEHIGAAVSLILEEKLALGLAAPPPERLPAEALSETDLIAQALSEREQRARDEKFRLHSTDTSQPWTDYDINSAASGKTYRVALRGEQRGLSYCSCPDFRTNTLGICKHVFYALDRVRRKFSAAKRRKPYRNNDIFVHVLYGEELTLHLCLPDKPDSKVRQMTAALLGSPIEDVRKLVTCLGELQRLGHEVTVYPDAEELIEKRLFQQHITDLVAEIRRNPAKHPLRRELLKTELLPYQLDGIAFAAGAGRAVLADDMGLGKTIQGIGVAELLAREANIRKVLIVCPASLKSQWRNEIHRFSDRSAKLVVGRADERADQYSSESFFTICNYEQVLKDLEHVEQTGWDLIILDEGQRIKNWETKTSRVIKGLKSQFALVLSGTPLENRLDDLYSVVQFIDDRRLGPAFRFFHRHRVVDEKGKVLGYKNLDQLRANLGPVLLRRTRQSVLKQLPPRSTEVIRIAPTEEQRNLHDGHMRIVSMITRKSYISEMDLLRLQKALLMCRMAANSTYLVDKSEPGYSSKLQHMEELLGTLLDEGDRKIVLFSEWTTMLNLTERLLGNADFVRLDGSVPQKKRQQLVNEFQQNDRCRLFLTTNAGSTGLNLQAANTVVNVDLPWNPAVLEQRIARAHRMGQKRPVQVFLLVTEETLEENLLATLSAKNELALAALDSSSHVNEVEMSGGMEELRRRLEVLLGARPEAAVDKLRQEQTKDEAEKQTQQRERVAAAGGELLGAAFNLLDQLVGRDSSPAPSEKIIGRLQSQLSQCLQEDEQGRQQLTVTLPDRNALDNLARTMAHLLVAGGENESGIQID